MILILGSISATLFGAIAVAATVITILAGAAVWSVFRGSRSQVLSQSQTTALDALKSELTAYQSKADRLEGDNARQRALGEQQEKRLTAQQHQINHLQEMVTQAAKVDALIGIVKQGFASLGVPVSELVVKNSKEQRR